MKKSKFGTFVLLGAFLGGAASMLDTTTRNHVIGKSKRTISALQYYGKNRDELKLKVQAEKEKYESMFQRLSEDATYLKEKVDEFKDLTPQVKELVSDAKEAFVESKEDFQSIIAESTQEEPLGK